MKNILEKLKMFEVAILGEPTFMKCYQRVSENTATDDILGMKRRHFGSALLHVLSSRELLPFETSSEDDFFFGFVLIASLLFKFALQKLG